MAGHEFDTAQCQKPDSPEDPGTRSKPWPVTGGCDKVSPSSAPIQPDARMTDVKRAAALAGLVPDSARAKRQGYA